MGPAIPVLGAPLGSAFISFYFYFSRVLGLKSGYHQTNFDLIWTINSSELSFCICEVDLTAPAFIQSETTKGKILHKAPSECTAQDRQVSYVTIVVSGTHTKAVDWDAFQCPWPLGGVPEPVLGGERGAISCLLTPLLSHIKLQPSFLNPPRLAASLCLTFYSFHKNFDVCFNGISPRAGASCESCISYLSACQSVSPYSDGYPLCIPLSPGLGIIYALVPKGTPYL